MNREDIHVCAHCRCDLPRHVVGKVWYCSEACFEAEEGPRDTLVDLNPAACTLASERAGEL